MSSTRTDRLIASIKNHKALSPLIVLGLATTAIAGVVTAVARIREAVTPDLPSIASIVVGYAPGSKQYQVTVVNPAEGPALISHVRLLERSQDSASAVPPPPGAIQLCASGPVYLLADEVSLERSAIGSRLTGDIQQLGGAPAAYSIAAYGWLYEQCGGADRGFILEFDAAVNLPPRDNTSFFVRIPDRLRVQPDSFRARSRASLERRAVTVSREEFLLHRGLDVYTNPQSLEHGFVYPDSLLRRSDQTRVRPRLRTIVVNLLTADGRELKLADTLRSDRAARPR